MNIEEEIFKRCEIDFDKLKEYGFIKQDKTYEYSKNIMNDKFKIVITVDNDSLVSGKIYDLKIEEEYLNYRSDYQVGEFVSTVRENFKELLNDIKDKCTIPKYFISKMANKVADYIFATYHDLPEFPWEKTPGAGVFRNKDNEKWYGLIMNINKNKLDRENREVEIINVKLEKSKVKEIVKKKGFYQAYHMNKEHWVSILLDGSVSFEDLVECIKESHQFTETKNSWLIPANPKYYDVINCFNDTDIIDWKQSNNIKVGDTVYLYVGHPYSSILYKCVVLEVNIPYNYQDKFLTINKIMKIKLVKRYKEGIFNFNLLKECGINAIRGPRSINEKLSKLLNK